MPRKQALGPLLGAVLVACGLLCRPLPAAARTLRIVIENMAFSPVPAEAHVGDVVEWFNKGFLSHTATARDGSFDIVVAPGKIAGRMVLRRPGSIPFYCRFHPNMTGEIRVGP